MCLSLLTDLQFQPVGNEPETIQSDVRAGLANKSPELAFTFGAI